MGALSGGVSFDLPWPPSVNRYYRHLGGRVLISREGRRFRMMVTSRLADLGARLSGTVGLSADCHPPDRRRRDLDNILKALQDAIIHAGVLDDDSQIRLLHLEMKEPAPPGGTVHVHLAPLPAGGG